MTENEHGRELLGIPKSEYQGLFERLNEVVEEAVIAKQHLRQGDRDDVLRCCENARINLALVTEMCQPPNTVITAL